RCLPTRSEDRKKPKSRLRLCGVTLHTIAATLVYFARMQEALPYEVNDRLAKERNIWIVTVRRDGRPHMVPVWFVWFESKIYVCIEPESVKGRNILLDRKSTRLNSSHEWISYAGF